MLLPAFTLRMRVVTPLGLPGHTLPPPPTLPSSTSLPPPPSHLPERIVKFIFIFMAWLCFNAALSACLCALFAAFKTFSELATVQLPFPPPHRLPLLPFVSAAAFFACHLTACWHFYKIHVRVYATFVSSLCSSPLPTPLFACFTVFAAGQLNCLAFHSFSLFFFFCSPPLTLFIFDNFYFIGQAFFTLAMHFLGQQMFAV